MTRTIDLNADVGEGVGDDAALIPLVTSASIACGAHAGDDATMDSAVLAAVGAGVTIGAHPGHADREGFGRRPMPLTRGGLAELIAPQIERLQTIAARRGATVRYVKLHGALYHQVASDAELAAAAVRVVKQSGNGLVLLGPNGSEIAAEARAAAAPFATEAFADRRYRGPGTLEPRTTAGAVFDQPGIAAEQAVRIAIRGSVVASTGEEVSVHGDSLCLHGDQPNAVGIARSVRHALQTARMTLRPFAVRPD